jgi:hypothetical protein
MSTGINIQKDKHSQFTCNWTKTKQNPMIPAKVGYLEPHNNMLKDTYASDA